MSVTKAPSGLSTHDEACADGASRCKYWSGPFTLSLSSALSSAAPDPR